MTLEAALLVGQRLTMGEIVRALMRGGNDRGQRCEAQQCNEPFHGFFSLQMVLTSGIAGHALMADAHARIVHCTTTAPLDPRQ
jgi:hypothetical protein